MKSNKDSFDSFTCRKGNVTVAFLSYDVIPILRTGVKDEVFTTGNNNDYSNPGGLLLGSSNRERGKRIYYLYSGFLHCVDRVTVEGLFPPVPEVGPVEGFGGRRHVELLPKSKCEERGTNPQFINGRTERRRDGRNFCQINFSKQLEYYFYTFTLLKTLYLDNNGKVRVP